MPGNMAGFITGTPWQIREDLHQKDGMCLLMKNYSADKLSWEWSCCSIKSNEGSRVDRSGRSGQKGFCGLPGGARAVNGEFYGLTSYGYWWSSTETSPATALIRILSYVDCDIHFFDYSKSCGISVRCIRN